MTIAKPMCQCKNRLGGPGQNCRSCGGFIRSDAEAAQRAEWARSGKLERRK